MWRVYWRKPVCRGVGQPAAIVGYVGVADCEEGVALGHLVAVENYLLRGVFCGIGEPWVRQWMRTGGLLGPCVYHQSPSRNGTETSVCFMCESIS